MSGTIQAKERATRIIGVASGLGAPAWAYAGCARGPAVLREAGIDAAVRRNGGSCRWEAMLAPLPGLRQAALAPLCRELAALVALCLADGDLPVVIGGDHALAAGTWRGATRVHGPAFGLLWIDAHLDAHTPNTSPSGNLHGMPLAALLGADVPLLDDIEGPCLDPRHVCILGARSFEAAENSWLKAQGVKIFGMKEIQQRGLAAVWYDALRHVRENTTAYGLSIDLDAVDPGDAPGVSTPAAAGFAGAALCQSLRGLAQDAQLAAIEIAEFNPDHDPDGRTARLAIALLESLTAPPAEQLQPWASSQNLDAAIATSQADPAGKLPRAA